MLFVFTYCRVESVEKVSPVEKRYEPQISPSSQYGPPASAIPPNTLPKLSPNDGKLSNFSWLSNSIMIHLSRHLSPMCLKLQWCINHYLSGQYNEMMSTDNSALSPTARYSNDVNSSKSMTSHTTYLEEKWLQSLLLTCFVWLTDKIYSLEEKHVSVAIPVGPCLN